MRIPKTLTMEESVLADVKRTKGGHSTSERVNQLLKVALRLESQQKLDQEAALFYSRATNRQEEHAFQKASQRSIARD
jgi:hypothetical protein